MQLNIQRGHEVQTDRKGRPKGVSYWFSYRLEAMPDELAQIEVHLGPHHNLYDAPALKISVQDLLEGRHTNRGSVFESVLVSEQAIRKAASRLVSDLTMRSSYAGSTVLHLTGEDDDND